eukprot:TRINITY_DN29941_c0_g1_i1.p2 TRINITY_DN29941_c0_g1~~TRINITY_DN29941_c0_g1_i1.p2  ORF type:complete len:101 (+),score=8.20 TRINITY_DN29941_c0_g1_i1:217-519(+)
MPAVGEGRRPGNVAALDPSPHFVVHRPNGVQQYGCAAPRQDTEDQHVGPRQQASQELCAREDLFPTLLSVNFLVFHKLCLGLFNFHILQPCGGNVYSYSV